MRTANSIIDGLATALTATEEITIQKTPTPSNSATRVTSAVTTPTNSPEAEECHDYEGNLFLSIMYISRHRSHCSERNGS